MAMSISSLSAKIKSELEAVYGLADDDVRLQKFCDAVATAVYDEVTQNAVVPATGTVTTGPGAGGAVVTTGTVT